MKLIDAENIFRERFQKNMILEQVLERDTRTILDEYERNDDAYKAYLNAIKLIDVFSQEEKCSYKFYNPDIPYDMHIITITWEDTTEIEIERIIKLLKYPLSIKEKDNNILVLSTENDWDLGFTIYKGTPPHV